MRLLQPLPTALSHLLSGVWLLQRQLEALARADHLFPWLLSLMEGLLLGHCLSYFSCRVATTPDADPTSGSEPIPRELCECLGLGLPPDCPIPGWSSGMGPGSGLA